MDEKRGVGFHLNGASQNVLPLYGNGSDDGASSAQPQFRTLFASVSLHMRDRIRLLRFPEEDVIRIQDVVRRTWPRGIQDLRVYDASNEIKVHGNPWGHGWNSDKIQARRLICGLLAGLFDMGWILKASVDISKKEFDKDTLIFRKQQPAPPPCLWMSISFDKGDLMHLIDGPPELARSLVQALGERVQSCEDQGLVFEIKLKGYPWRESGTRTVQTRVILLIMLECLEQHGFSLYASIDQENGPGGDSHRSEADVWFCNRQSDWMPGVPMYH